MISKKFFSAVLLLLLISLFLSNCTVMRENTHFKFVGESFIPEGLILGSPITIGNQVYFLEHKTDNIFIASIMEYKDKEVAYDFYLTGSYFKKTVLKYPVSICSDENNTLFVLETGDEVDLIGLRIIPSSGYQFPVHIKAIYSSGEIKEISNLHLKLKELKQIKEAVKIGYCHGYLVIMFDNLNSLLFLEKTSLEKNILSYFMLDLPGRPIDFDTSKDSFVVLLDDFTLLKYEYNPVSNNAFLKDQIKVQNLTSSSRAIFSEINNLIILWDLGKKKMHIIKNNSQDIIVSSKEVLNVFKLKRGGGEDIIVLKREKGRGSKEYTFIYRIT